MQKVYTSLLVFPLVARIIMRRCYKVHLLGTLTVTLFPCVLKHFRGDFPEDVTLPSAFLRGASEIPSASS